MDSKQIKELKQQLRDAKRTGDLEWAKELEERIKELEKQEKAYLLEPSHASMDDTPENDEETIERLYELDPEVQAELEAPMTLGYLIDPEAELAALHTLLAGPDSLKAKVVRCLQSLVGRNYFEIDEFTFGLSIDLPIEDFAKLIRANRVNGQTIKHGQDFVARYRTPLGDLEIRTDSRGNIDSISVL